MAERPVFIPSLVGPRLVEEVPFSFTWNAGFAPIQKKKNIAALHEAAAAKGYSPLLEISTKSDVLLGQRLSAFSLKVITRDRVEIPLECAFQGSKIFEHGGPFTDLYSVDARAAKRDPRVRSSGRIVGFRFDGFAFPIEPKTAFYDWLYVGTLFPHRVFLQRLELYAGFTDVEFNPGRSINCQARSCAMFVAMMKKCILETAIRSPADFISFVTANSYPEHHSRDDPQGELF